MKQPRFSARLSLSRLKHYAGKTILKDQKEVWLETRSTVFVVGLAGMWNPASVEHLSGSHQIPLYPFVVPKE
jgi:hypothetical protein